MVDINFSSVALAATFFFLGFLALCFAAGFAACVASAAGVVADCAGATSAAQAGTTIKANNSNIFFMVVLPPFVVKKIAACLNAVRSKLLLLLHRLKAIFTKPA